VATGAILKRILEPWQMTDPCAVAGGIPRVRQTGESASRCRFGGSMVIRERWSFQGIRDVLGSLLEQDLHAKRVNSLCDATLGVLHSGSLAICAIGQGLAAARYLKPKHAIKQVDRLLSNAAINVDDILVRWVPFVIGARSCITVAMDWTDFDADNQATIMLAVISDHGRSTPLVWLTVDKSTLKDHRSFYEHRVLVRLAELLPAGIKVCIVADRGFGDQKLYKMLTEELYFDYVIRFRGNITVTATSGETRTAAEWVQAGGRARVLRGAEVTADRYRVGTVVCVQDPKMKQAWCLAASSIDATAKQLTGLYGRRWGIECSLRDSKDLRFGMGLGTIHVKSPERRDRLWLINAFAVVLLTLLGAAGEALGYHRMLKASTVKRRVHSLFRQGCLLYDLLPGMRDDWLRPLMQRFSQMLLELPLFADVFGPI
jgi:Transposase DDE domain